MSLVHTLPERPFDTEDLIKFARAFGEPCFDHWPDSILAEYLAWHARLNTLYLVKDRAALVALAVGWQAHEPDIERHWIVNNPGGDSFYLAHVIAIKPLAIAGLVTQWTQRVPGWEKLKIFARRRNRLVRYSPRLIQRMIWKGFQHER